METVTNQSTISVRYFRSFHARTVMAAESSVINSCCRTSHCLRNFTESKHEQPSRTFLTRAWKVQWIQFHSNLSHNGESEIDPSMSAHASIPKKWYDCRVLCCDPHRPRHLPAIMLELHHRKNKTRSWKGQWNHLNSRLSAEVLANRIWISVCYVGPSSVNWQWLQSAVTSFASSVTLIESML